MCSVDGGHFAHLQVNAHVYIRVVLALFVVSHRKRQSWQQVVASTVIIVVGLVDFVPITRNAVELLRLCEDGMPAMREVS